MKTIVGVLFGGRSVENEISVVTASQVIEALDRSRYEIVPIYIAKTGKWYSGTALLDLSNYRNMDSLCKKCKEVYFKVSYGQKNLFTRSSLGFEKVVSRIDTILPTLHGTNCEDGTIQGVFASIGMPFVGCNTFSSANGMDKISMKQILRDSGISVVDFYWFNDKQWDNNPDMVLDGVENQLGYPVIVKPANSGSSVGIAPAHNREELAEAIRNAAGFTTRIIVEKLLENLKEVNCSVLGNYNDCTSSVCEVPMRSGEILTYDDKYKQGGAKSKGMRSTKRELPAKISDNETELIKDLATRTFRILACEGVARIDFMIDQTDRRVYVNEINTIPGSLSSYLWDYTGISFPKMLDSLIARSFEREREESFKITDFGGNIFKSLPAKGAKLGGTKFNK